jgi:hypothetical protein
MAVRELIFNNFWLKLFSLVLATMIWFIIWIQNTAHPERDAVAVVTREFTRHPITVMKSSQDTRGFRVVPGLVDIVISGRPELIQNLSEKSIEVYVDMTDARDVEGLRKPVQFFVPNGVTVVQVDPPSVQIERVRNE